MQLKPFDVRRGEIRDKGRYHLLRVSCAWALIVSWLGLVAWAVLR